MAPWELPATGLPAIENWANGDRIAEPLRAASQARPAQRHPKSPERTFLLTKESANIAGVDAQLRALAEPRRRDILRLVWSQELPAGAIAASFAVTRPAISQHLTVLKAAGLLTERRDGTRRLYRARQQQLAEVLAFLQTFWDESLAALKQAAEAEDREERQRDECR
jgi:DNA-binding transcriptional ArsR family regulator